MKLLFESMPRLIDQTPFKRLQRIAKLGTRARATTNTSYPNLMESNINCWDITYKQTISNDKQRPATISNDTQRYAAKLRDEAAKPSRVSSVSSFWIYHRLCFSSSRSHSLPTAPALSLYSSTLLVLLLRQVFRTLQKHTDIYIYIYT